MKLFLLSCQNIDPYAQRILPRLPQRRQADYARSGSKLTLGAGLMLSSLLGVRRDEDVGFGPYGKPHLPAGAPEFSLSHAGEHVLLGVSDLPIGVDLERRERHVNEATQKRICLPSEMDLDPLLVFTRKECAMKLTGLGFSLPLRDIDTTTPFCWQERTYRFFTTDREGYLVSVLTSEDELPPIQLLAPADLL